MSQTAPQSARRVALPAAAALALVLAVSADARAATPPRSAHPSTPALHWVAPRPADAQRPAGRCELQVRRGALRAVEFSVDGRPLGRDTRPPYRCAWRGLAAGRHRLAAVAVTRTGRRVRARLELLVARPSGPGAAPPAPAGAVAPPAEGGPAAAGAQAPVAAPATSPPEPPAAPAPSAPSAPAASSPGPSSDPRLAETAPPSAGTLGALRAGCELVMHDTFSGSSVDLAHWAVYQKHGHERWGLRHPSALSVADGMLTITARNDPAHPYWRRARELWGTIVGEIVSGGMAHRVPVQFGRWEARVRVDGDPTGATSGLVLTWPSAGGVWPVDGENNVWETGGNPTRTPVFAFHHYDVTNKQFSRRLDIDGRQWHTVALERLPGGTLRHTIDGRASYEIRSPLIPEHPHQLTLQLDALAARTGEPVRMQVDEVRVARCDA